MKLYGYAPTNAPVESIRPEELAEITLCADPSELKQIARFLLDCAEEMERMAATYDHAHLSDRIRSFESSPHFVVSRAEP
jgi:hypothetical protein